MCTLSVIAGAAGLSVIMNRDEQRTRPPALPPAWRTLPSGTRAIWPTDPAGGGTWIAASTRGLICALLNGNPDTPPPRLDPAHERSRGSIIPVVIDSPDAAATANAVASLDLGAFRPFRFVAMQRAHEGRAAPAALVIDLVWNGLALARTDRTTPAACFTSSGLGDALVACRLPLFDELVARHPTLPAQTAFHAHRWPEPSRSNVSVLMSRADARTVSVCTVRLRDADVEMDYRAVDP